MTTLLRETALEMLGPAVLLATVLNLQDPINRNRVQVTLYNTNGLAGQDGPVWARVAVPFAGNSRGAFFIPDIGDEVLVAFLGGDPRYPIIIGSMWNGKDQAPETLGGNTVDRWSFTGKAGTRIAIVEENAASATIAFSTPGGLKGTFTDQGGGSIELTNSSNTSIKIDSTGITIAAPTGKVQINAASEIDMTAPTVNVNAALSQFSGIVKCTTLQSTVVLSSVYSLGAGNVW